MLLTENIVNKIIIFILLMINGISFANTNDSLKSDPAQVKKWNNFVDELYKIHINNTKNISVKKTMRIDGYGGGFANKEFYREISYFNKKTNKLISIIQWEINNPDTIHTIEVFLYDNKGRIKTDFYARYLPYARNSPVQTLINLHDYNDKLHSFRQFDANGELMYETCRGEFFDKKINLHLDDEEIIEFRTKNDDELLNEAYSSCFNNTPSTAQAYLQPSKLIEIRIKSPEISIEQILNTISIKIFQQPQNASLYIKRGNLYFQLHDFDKAINDFNTSISIDNTLQEAYFERGMALARNGKIEEGIKDLTYYIKFNPNSSLAYTKRGVRYIWANKLVYAKKDLIQAIKLDKTNSEAHDDLGVVYAQQHNYKAALKHFSLAIQNDPSYQKAYHNLALVYVITHKSHKALGAINKSLLLNHDSRNSLILKSEILKTLGNTEEAKTVMRKAEFLPEGNWSEQYTIR